MATRCVICDAEIDPYYQNDRGEWEKHCLNCKEIQWINVEYYHDVFKDEEKDNDR